MVAREVAAGDFNGDGRGDVAVLVSVTGMNAFDVRLLVQHPDGTLVESSTYRLPGGIGAGTGMAAGDLNEDGRDDVIVTHWNLAGFGYLLSQPGGGFEWREEDWTHLPPIGSARVADLDNDGHLDVIVPLRLFAYVAGADSGRFVTSFGDGAGSFFRRAVTSAAERESIALGNLDGDPFPDLLAAGGKPENPPVPAGYPPALLWRNDGSGNWLPPATLDPAPGEHLLAAIVTDLTGEGRADAVMLRGGGVWPNFLVFPQSATGELASSPLRYFARDYTTRLLDPDLDGNGRRDAAATRSLALALLLARRTGAGLSAGGAFAIGQHPFQAHGMAAGDFDGDGVVDVAVATEQGLIDRQR